MSPLPRWLARGLLVGEMSMRRHVRKAREHPWIAFFQVFATLFGVVVAVGWVPVAGYRHLWEAPGGYVLGRLVATEGPSVLSLVRGFAGVVFVLLVFLTVLKETTQGAMDAHVDALLVAAGPRSVAVGNLTWNFLLTGWQFGGVVLAGAVALGVGARSPAVAATLAVAGLALLATAVPTGYVLALAIRLVFRRVKLVRDHRIALGAPLALAYFGLFVRVRESMAVLGGSPLGWYADAGLAVATGAADPVRGVAVVALTPLVVLGFGAVSVALGTRVWYDDPPQSREDADDRGGTALPGVDSALELVASRPTAAVTRTVWRRLRREPRTLVFAALPVALTGSVGIELAARRPASLPVVIGVYGGATVGMGATLNPLGSAGAGLPAVLTTPDGGRHLVRGFVLSAALPGAPVLAGLALGSALSVGLGVPVALAVAALAGALAVTAAVVSMAVGVALPNLQGLRPTDSGIRPPRLWATTLFLVVMALLGTPALVGVGWADALAADGSGARLVAGVGVVATLSLAAVASAVAYRRTLSTIVGYTMD